MNQKPADKIARSKVYFKKCTSLAVTILCIKKDETQFKNLLVNKT